MDRTQTKQWPSCSQKLEVGEDGEWIAWGTVVNSVSFVDDLNLHMMNNTQLRKGTGNYLSRRIAVCWNGDKYQTANEYFNDSKVWKRILSGPIKQEHLNQEVMNMVKKFKKAMKTAHLNKCIASAMFYITKRENLSIDKHQIFEALNVKEKGFMKFYSVFKQKLGLIQSEVKHQEESKLNCKIECKREELDIFARARKLDFERKNQSIASSASSSKIAVMASPINGQVDKNRAEVLNNLLSTYASLVLNHIFDPISSLSPLNSLQWSSTLIIETQKHLLDWLSHFSHKSTINPK